MRCRKAITHYSHKHLPTLFGGDPLSHNSENRDERSAARITPLVIKGVSV